MKKEFITSFSAYENIKIVTHLRPDAFPSPLRQKRKIQTKVHESAETRTIVRFPFTADEDGASFWNIGERRMPELRSSRSILSGKAGIYIPVLRTRLHASDGVLIQMRGVDEGSTILYSVRRLSSVQSVTTTLLPPSVRLLQAWMAPEQLKN